MMKKFRLLFLTMFAIIVGTLLFGTESNATSLEDVKENINFANNNQEYIVSGKNEISINESVREASEQGTKEGKQAIVYIPKGVYNINDRILVNSNVYILFEDGAVINRSKNSSYKIFQLGGSQRGVFVPAKNVTIDGGIFNGNSGTDSIIHMQDAENIIIKNSTLTENKAGKQGINIITSKNVNIQNCTISGNAKNGIAISTSSVANLNGNNIFNNIERGIYISNKSKATIKNSTVTANEMFGISADNSVLNMSGKNKITKNIKHGIHITNGTVATIDSVNVNNNGLNNGYFGPTHGICVSNKGNLTLSNSNVTSNGWNGVSVSGESQAKIYNSYFSNHGIGKIKGRKIKSDDDCGHGIGISMGSTGTIYNNKIEKNGGCGISVSYRAKADIYNNIITTSGRHAIGLTRGAYVNVYSNVIKDNDYNGILISVGSSGDIHDNKTIDNNKVNGVSVMDSSKCNIKNNSIKNNGLNAIVVGAGTEWSEYEPATDSKGNTDEAKKGKKKLRGSSANIQKNILTGSKKHGISVSIISKAIIKNKNNITKNGRSGIAVQGASVVNIYGKNTISKNKENGIYVADKSTKVQIDSNTIKQNKQSGIYVKNKAVASTINKNTITNNREYGIRLYKATAKKIKKNSLSNPTSKYEIYINKQSSSNVDSIKPVKINNVKKKNKKVTGIGGKNGLNATIKLGSKTYKSKIKKEKYSIKIPKQNKKGVKITVKLEDKAGNVVSNSEKVK